MWLWDKEANDDICSLKGDTYEIQNREKHGAGDVDYSAVCPEGVFGAVSEPLSGRDSSSAD